MAETIHSEEIVGRQGLKIPTVDETLAYNGGYKAVDFFQKLWKLNGFDVSTEPEYNGRRYVSKPFDHELVIPSATNKPLTVLRASFLVRNEHEVERELDRNKARAEWGSYDSAISATESYVVAVPPTELGPFEQVTRVSYSHKVGGSGMSWAGEDTHIRHLGEGLVKEYWTDLESVAAEMPEPIDPRDLRDQRFNAAVTQVLKQTIELLVN